MSDRITKHIDAHRLWVSDFMRLKDMDLLTDDVIDMFSNSRTCEFGHWLATDECVAELGEQFYQKIFVIHEQLHTAANVALAEKSKRTHPTALNPKFYAVISYSNVLIELLEFADNHLKDNMVIQPQKGDLKQLN